MVTKPRLPRTSPDERRDQIVEVARGIFRRDGYAATSMSTIAAALGGSKATLYKYFSTKEQLFAAVMAKSCADVLEPLRDPDLPNGNIDILLQAYAVRFLNALFKPEALDLVRLVHAEGARFPEVAHLFFAGGPDPTYDWLAAHLRRAAAGGEIRCDDPLLAAQQFLGMVRGDLHMRVMCGAAAVPTAAEIERQAAHAAKIFAAGLRV